MKTNKTLTELLKILADKPMAVLAKLYQAENTSAKVRLAAVTWIKALNGDRDSRNTIYDRLEGRVPPAKPEMPEPVDVGEEFMKALERIYGDEPEPVAE